jgi:hypothetical protein
MNKYKILNNLKLSIKDNYRCSGEGCNLYPNCNVKWDNDNKKYITEFNLNYKLCPMFERIK